MFQGGTSFVDLLCFCSVLCLLCLCARLFICALWSPAGKGLTSWLSFVVCHFSIGLGQVWYLIVSIPDLCTLTYCYKVCTNYDPRLDLYWANSLWSEDVTLGIFVLQSLYKL